VGFIYLESQISSLRFEKMLELNNNHFHSTAAACVCAALPRVCVRCAHAVCCVYALGAAAS
jgi:hypothetical protein